MSEKVLVTAAYRGELDRLDSLPPGWIAQPCGIGGVASAAGLAMLMTVHAPTRIIVLGTCGALGRGLSIGSLVAPKLVRWVDPSVLNGAAHMPPEVYKPLRIVPWPGLIPSICLQTPSVTLAADHATRLGTMSEGGMPAVEHLELYSMAFVAHTFGLPITAILGVTNSVGPTGHRDWLANHANVEMLVQEALLRSEKPRRASTPSVIMTGPAWPANGSPIDSDTPQAPQNDTPQNGNPTNGSPKNGSPPKNGKPPLWSPPGGPKGPPMPKRWLSDEE
jgi:hypothetical protein